MEKSRLQRLAELSNGIEQLYEIVRPTGGTEKCADELLDAMTNIDAAIVHVAKASAEYKRIMGQSASMII